MKIMFYEEFPDEKNLQKLKLIKFKTKIIIASKSLKEFNKWKEKINKIKKNTEVIFWPILENSYWISTFSNKEDLIKLIKDLENFKGELLIDLELPLKRKMIIKNLFSFPKNKKIIREFLEKNKKRITTAQYPLSFFSKIQQFLGLDYNIKTKKSLMWYSSMNSKRLNNKIKQELPKIKNKNNYSISLGTIKKGIFKNEPILNPENLRKDLLFVKKAGFKEIILFRLEGLNKEYLKILSEFKN